MAPDALAVTTCLGTKALPVSVLCSSQDLMQRLFKSLCRVLRVDLGLVEISSHKDAIVNLFLLLYAISSSSRRGYLYGRVKLQKLLYEAQKRMMEKGLRAFSYVFYRWKHGAYSPEADWGLNWLERNGLVEIADEGISITHEGIEVLEGVKGLLDRNMEAAKIIQQVAEVYALDSGKVMKAMAYGLPSPESGKRIGDAERGEVVLRPLDKEKAPRFFLADDPEIETIEILLDKESRESIEEAMNDARQGRVAPFKSVG